MYWPDAPVSMAFGGLIVASNLGRVKTGQSSWDELKKRSLYQTLAFGLIFHCADSFFAFIWYPDWNLGYVTPFARIGYGGALLMEVGLLLLLLLGRWLALAMAREKFARVLWPILVSFALFAVVMALVWDRYQHVGSFADYHRGTAALAAADPVFTMFTALAGAYLLIPFLVLLATNFIQARKIEK